MGIDLATWRAQIGLNYYHMCRPLQTRWKSSDGQLYQPGVASWGVGEVMNDTTLVLKGCVTVVALSLILQYVVCSWSKLKGKGGSGKVHCHCRESTFHVRGTVDGGGTLLLRAIVVVIPILLVIAGDVETNPGPPKREGTALTLKAAINALHSVCTKWYNIGVQLDIPTFQLKIIERKSSDSMDQLRDVLDFWMSNDPSSSWSHIVDALKAPSVGENRLAEEIHETKSGLEEQHCCNVSEVSVTAKCYQDASIQDVITPKGISLTAAPTGVPLVIIESPTTTTEHSSTTPPPNEESQKPPFGCGCGKCTLFSFIESGCPTPIPSTSSFPYLNVSGLTHEQQEDLRERLRFESREIMMQFQELVSKTIKSFIRQNVPLDELVSHVMTLVAFDPDPVYKKPQVALFQDCLQKLEAADTIPKVFLVLNNYFSFFNYDIIEHIIGMLGTKDDQNNLQSYKEKFDQYARRRIYECGPHFGPESGRDHADIFVKLDSRYDNYTVAEIKGFCRKISKTLHLSSGGVLRLCRVEKGCIQLIFQVPSFVQQETFPLSRKQEEALEAEGVITLTCGEYKFSDFDENSQRSATSQAGLIQGVNEYLLQNTAKCSSSMTEAADLCPEKATELRKRDSGFFSAGTTPLTPLKELDDLAQNRTITEGGWKMTAKAISSDVKDDLLSAFCCRQENETDWGDCSHSHCNNTRTQLEHFKSCSSANSTTQSCEQCTSFQRLVLSHALNCRSSDGSCPVPMCSDAKMKLVQYSQKRRSSTSDLTQLPPATMQRKGSVGSFFLKQYLSSAPSYIAARNDLTAAGIGNLPSKLVTDLKTKVEEIVLQLEKQSLTEDDYHTPESSIPSCPSNLHHSTQSGVSKASGISGQGDIQYVPPLASQGMLSPIDEVPSLDVEPSPASQAEYYPLQHILHTLDPDCLSKGRDHFYYQDRDYMVNNVSPLGEGGFGTFVVGQDKFTESIFAIKQNNRDDKEKIESLRAECNILAQLHGGHDNIVQFFGAVMEENEKEYPPRLCKMFMEFAENGNLYSMLEDEEGDRTPLPVDQSLYYLQQILQAVHYLHSNSILHCDIKSLNVLVFNNGRVVKLTDFGSAIHVEDITTLGAAKLKGCTPFFAAPEVVYEHQPTFSMDVWSTLCVFVEMLTARLPGCYKVQRNQNSMLYLVGKYTDDQIELLIPLSELQLDPSVAELFHKVLRRDHTQRPTAVQLLNHPQILDACEYEKYFDLEYEGEYMEEYESDQQQTQRLDSDEEFFHTAPSNILNIPVEEMPKPGKRVCISIDSGRGDSVADSSSGCDGSVRYREYDSGLETPVDVSSTSRRFTFSRWKVQPPSFIQEEMEDEGRKCCLEKSLSCPDIGYNLETNGSKACPDIGYNLETNGGKVQIKTTLRRTSSEVYVDRGPVFEGEKQTSHYTTRHSLNKHVGKGSATLTAPTELKSTAQGPEKKGKDQSINFFHLI